jgi:myo-inositol-1(or 4)-monophosphatase
MMDDELTRRLEAATTVAREAGALALRYFRDRSSLTIELKGRQDLVSEADRNVELLIRARLGALFPGDAFLGEEEGGVEADRLWVIDPIDGTLNFLRGLPCWAVVIAWVEAARTLLGVTYDPVNDELWSARRGAGAFRNGERIAVAPTTEPTTALAGVTFNFKQPADRYLALLAQLCAEGFEHRRLGSTAITLCYVADGRCDALATLDCRGWDVLPGLLTVEEAGGVATDFIAEHSLLGKGGCIASVPALQSHIEAASGLRFRRSAD